MNYKLISEKCPKAWQYFLSKQPSNLSMRRDEEFGYSYTDGVHSVTMFTRYNDRNLYDFFDENGIVCNTKVAYARGGVVGGHSSFAWTHTIEGQPNHHTFAGHKYNRVEEEEIMFTRAFQILEQRLEQA